MKFGYILVLTLCCMLILQFSAAQGGAKEDSLLNVLKQTEGTKLECDALNKLGEFYLNSDYQLALQYAQKAGELSKKTNNPSQEAQALNTQGKAYFYLGTPDEALSYFDLCIQLSTTQALDEVLAKALSNSGSVYNALRDYPNAIDYFKKALEVNRRIDNYEEQSRLLNQIGFVYYQQSDNKEAERYYIEAVEICTEFDLIAEKATAFDNLGGVYYAWSEYEKAIDYYTQSLEIHRKQSNEQGIASSQINIGLAYLNMSEYDKAITCFQDALTISQRIGYQRGIAHTISHIARTYEAWLNYAKALEYYKEALVINEQIGDVQTYAWTLVNIANLYKNIDEPENALEYYLKALEIQEQIGDFTDRLATTLTNIVDTYITLGNFNQAIVYAKQALALQKQVNNYTGIAQALMRLAKLYTIFGDSYAAIEHYNEALSISLRIKNPELTAGVYKNLSEVYEQTGNTTEAFRYFKKHTYLRDSLFTADKHKQFAELQTLYETEKTEKENQLLKQENKLKEAEIANQRTLIYSFIVILVLIVFFSVLVYRQFTLKKKAYHLLTEKNDQIVKQKQNITDSITYASRIQTAIMPPELILKESLPQYFILNRPRDIVSGDFYWMANRHDKLIVAVADCTGHGVPGAFMSMLGIAFLNQIVNKNETIHSDDILNELRGSIINSLHQTGRDDEAKDGMDIALVVIDKANQSLEFSGAYNPLFIVRGTELLQLRGDRMPIGIYIKSEEKSFSRHIEKMQKGDKLYMLSDGFVDQFGGKNKRKFLMKTFKEKLLEIAHLPMLEQKNILIDTLEEWKGTHEQVDDILIIGMEV